MPAPRKFIPEEMYAKTPGETHRLTPDPEIDVNVKRGIAWVIGGTASGAVFALAWFIYRLIAPLDQGQEIAGEISDYVVIPILGALYALIGAVSGGFVGLCVGIIFVGIAAFQASREADQEEEEQEDAQPLIRSGLRTSRGHS